MAPFSRGRPVFLHPPVRNASDVADQLGCARFEDGSLRVDELAQTTVAGVFAAGDCCRRAAMPKAAGQIVIAAAQGAIAAIAIDQLLFLEELASS